MRNNSLLSTLSCLILALPACGVGEQLSETQGHAIAGGPGGAPTDERGDVVVADPITHRLPAPGSPARIADCDGDGKKDCLFSVLRHGEIGGYSAQIRYTSPVTGQVFVETICNGDYNGQDPDDPSDDQPCNAAVCDDDNGPHPPPEVNFPPDRDGPCWGQTAGEICVPFGTGGARVCDCVTFDPASGLGNLYPDDSNGDGINDCPPAS